MDNFSAFTGGVTDGGIRDSVSAKILLCYLLQHAGDLSKDDMNSILQENGWMNYFEYTGALSDLAASNLIETVLDTDGNPVYHVTDQGIQTATALEQDVSYSLRQKVVRAALRLRERRYRNKGCTITVSPAETGYTVICAIGDGSSELMSLSLSVPNESMADFIKVRFENDPLTIYKGLMELLDAAAPTDSQD